MKFKSNSTLSIAILIFIILISLLIGWFLWEKGSSYSGLQIDHQTALESVGFVFLEEKPTMGETKIYTDDLTEMELATLFGSGARYAIVNLWQISCPPCKAELVSLNTLNKNLNGEFDIYIINLGESSSDWVKFIKDNRVELDAYGIHEANHFKMLQQVDLDGIVSIMPQTFIINSSYQMEAVLLGAINWRLPKVYRSLIALSTS